MAVSKIPSKFRQILVKSLGVDFRKNTEIIVRDMPKPKPNEVLIRVKYVGINASDVNFTAGRYFKEPKKPPFPCGFEGIGDVVEVGSESPFKEGQNVVFAKYGAFSEYLVAKTAEVIPVPTSDPALLSIVVSGLTASISLEKEGDLKPGKNVLVTAAAGGTGQFAVQLAKSAGCNVIGTCSNDAKVNFLKSIGCDRPVNYKVENLAKVLKNEFPTGIDVVYESIGNEMFDLACKSLAPKGRLIIIGMISGYQNDDAIQNNTKVSLPQLLLMRSASIRGFFLPAYTKDFAQHIKMQMKMYSEGKLKIVMDQGADKPFIGLEGVADAIDYLYSGKNVGKVMVAIANPTVKSSL